MALNIYEPNNEMKLAVKEELTEKNPVDTHVGGLGQDILKTNKKWKKAYGLQPIFWIEPTRMSLILCIVQGVQCILYTQPTSQIEK